MGSDTAVFHDGVIICVIASLETSVIVRFGITEVCYRIRHPGAQFQNGHHHGFDDPFTVLIWEVSPTFLYKAVCQMSH